MTTSTATTENLTPPEAQKPAKVRRIVPSVKAAPAKWSRVKFSSFVAERLLDSLQVRYGLRGVDAMDALVYVACSMDQAAFKRAVESLEPEPTSRRAASFAIAVPESTYQRARGVSEARGVTSGDLIRVASHAFEAMSELDRLRLLVESRKHAMQVGR